MPLPIVEDLKDYLGAAGLYSDPPSAIQSLLDLDGALGAAVERWNDTTHYWPFMSNGVTNETRYFTPPTGKVLDLNGGLLQISSLTTDHEYLVGGNNSLTTGVDKTRWRDFRLMPLDAAAHGKPFTYIELDWYAFEQGGVIAVSGEWGYTTSANMPASARRGILAIAADMLMPQVAMQVSRGGLKMLQRGDETKQWDLSMLGQTWKTDLNSALAMGNFVRGRVS